VVSVLKTFRKLGKWIDFQPQDARRIDDEIANLIGRLKVEHLRVSLDRNTPKMQEALNNCVEICERNNIKNLCVLVLYNWYDDKGRPLDKPEDMWERMHNTMAASKKDIVRIFPMYYRSTTDTMKEIKGNGNWTTRQVKNFRRALSGHKPYYMNTVIPVGHGHKDNMNIFHRVFGNSAEEFSKRMEAGKWKITKW
jgi:hypothetical protein